MKNFASRMCECVRIKKGCFIFLILFAIVCIVLGVFSAVNFGGAFVVDLSNISYVKFLKGDQGFVSFIFRLMFSLLIFYSLVFVFCVKPFLFPLGVLFFGYLVYSQTVVFVSIILIYGFFNCVVVSLLLLVYLILVFALFLLATTQMSCFCGDDRYFKCCCDFNSSNVILVLILLLTITLLFAFILTILKSFVILLVY